MNVNEALQASLRGGLAALALNQEIAFTAYGKQVLPVDGYVFWVPGGDFKVVGSLHFATERRQNEDETFGNNLVVFTSEHEIQRFNALDNQTLFIATIGNFRFAFRQQKGFYQQAGLWHYFGESVPPALASQLVDGTVPIDFSEAVVSNSLPFWLDLNSYAPPYAGFTTGVMLYPSYIVDENLVPPYGAVHIEPGNTEAIQASPRYDATFGQTQLTADRVRITLYGLQNKAALSFLSAIEQYSVDTDNFGIMNMPVVRDEKRTQPEIAAIAMKKTLSLDVSYYQGRANTIARKLILSAAPTFVLNNP